MRALFLAILLLGVAILPGGDERKPPSKKAPRVRAPRTLNPKVVRTLVERETGGYVVSVRQIPLNGATGGWEAMVHMPKAAEGLRCIVDNDSHMVVRRERIPNPPRSIRNR